MKPRIVHRFNNEKPFISLQSQSDVFVSVAFYRNMIPSNLIEATFQQVSFALKR